MMIGKGIIGFVAGLLVAVCVGFLLGSHFTLVSNKVILETQERDQVPVHENRRIFHDLLQLPRRFVPRKISYRSDLPDPETHKPQTVFKVDGEGCVRLMSFTMIRSHHSRPYHCTWAELAAVLRVRVYVDGEETPSVDSPLTNLFGVHHPKVVQKTKKFEVGFPTSNPIYHLTVNGCFTLNAPIPYKNGIHVTVTDMSNATTTMCVWCFLEYEEYMAGSLTETLRFKAKYRKKNERNGFHLGHASGKGHILGVSVGITGGGGDQWFHSGADMLVLDSDGETASVQHGIGGEDFFHETCATRHAFSFPSFGVQYSYRKTFSAGSTPLFFSGYRTFLDVQSMPFHSSFSIDFGRNEKDTLQGVTYWLQDTDDPIPKARKTTWTVFKREQWNKKNPQFYHPLEKYEDFQRVKLTVYQTFVDMSRAFLEPLTGNEKIPFNCTMVAISSSDFFEDSGCYELDVFHDDPIALYVNGKDLIYESNAIESGFVWKKAAGQFQIAKGSTLVAHVGNTLNLNFRAFGFGVKFSKCD